MSLCWAACPQSTKSPLDSGRPGIARIGLSPSPLLRVVDAPSVFGGFHVGMLRGYTAPGQLPRRLPALGCGPVAAASAAATRPSARWIRPQSTLWMVVAGTERRHPAVTPESWPNVPAAAGRPCRASPVRPTRGHRERQPTHTRLRLQNARDITPPWTFPACEAGPARAAGSVVRRRLSGGLGKSLV